MRKRSDRCPDGCQKLLDDWLMLREQQTIKGWLCRLRGPIRFKVQPLHKNEAGH